MNNIIKLLCLLLIWCGGGSLKAQVANFSFQQSGSIVKFTNTSTLQTNISSYHWDFGDNTSSTDLDPPCHTYASIGTYTVKLMINVGGSWTSSAVKEQKIIVKVIGFEPLSASFATTKTSSGVKFTPTVKGGNPCLGYTYSWNFNDNGATSTIEKPTHNYSLTTCNSYNVSLTVNNVGANTTTSKSILGGQQCAGVTITAPSYICNGSDPYVFTANVDASVGPTAALQYEWKTAGSPSIGSITQSTLSSTLTEVFANISFVPGPCLIEVTVRNMNGGYVGQASITIDIKSCSAVKPISSTAYTCPPSPIMGGQQFTINLTSVFANASNAANYLWFWDFGDGNTPNGAGQSFASQTHSYTTPGVYDIKVIVIDPSTGQANGEEAQVLCTVIVDGNLVVNCTDEYQGKWGHLDGDDDVDILDPGGPIGTASTLLNCSSPDASLHGDAYVAALGDDGLGGVYQLEVKRSMNPRAIPRAGLVKYNYPVMVWDENVWKADISGDFVGKDLVVDVTGNIYIVGDYNGRVDFYSANYNTHYSIFTGAGVAVAKYNSSGDILWLKSFVSAEAQGNAIGVDAEGNIIITGGYKNNIAFDNILLTTMGQSDAYVTKLNTIGNVMWAKSFQSIGEDNGTDLDVIPNGDIYVTGYFSESITFENNNYSSAGGTDVFMLKLTSGGSVSWAQATGGVGFDESTAIHATIDGDIFVGGNFNGSTTIGGTALSTSKTNGFLFKYNASNSSWDWVKQIGNPQNKTLVTAIDLDCNGKVHITGGFQKSFLFAGRHYTTNNAHEYQYFVNMWYDYSEVFVAEYYGDGTEYICRVFNCDIGSCFPEGNAQNKPDMGSNIANAIHVMKYRFYSNYANVIIGGRISDDCVQYVRWEQQGLGGVLQTTYVPHHFYSSMYEAPYATDDNGGLFLYGPKPTPFISFYISETGGCCKTEDLIIQITQQAIPLPTTLYQGKAVRSYGAVTMFVDSEAKAAYEVKLNPGFHAPAGLTFHAYIADICQGEPFYRPIDHASTTTSTIGSYGAASLEKTDVEIKSEVSTAVEKIPTTESLTIYPNPTTGITTMNVQLDDLHNASLSIWDIYGRELFNNPNVGQETNTYQFDFGTYPAGMYMVRLETTKGIITKKVIVQ